MIHGIDAAMPPTLAQAQRAFALGYRWCGFYPIGKDGDEDPYNTWPISAMDILIEGGLHPVPIFVPSPNLASDPVDAASEWYSICKTYNLSPGVSVLYDGSHITKSGEISGPVWLPIPGAPPASVGVLSAVQYGQDIIDGWTVDLNIASDDFPMSNGIVVDFEYNTTGGSIGINWYKAFQNQIAYLVNQNHINFISEGIEHMQIGNDPKGNLIIVGAATDGGDLLVFTQDKDNGNWTVMDVTDKIGTTPRAYRIV